MALAAAALSAPTGCAERLGARASRGAMQEMQANAHPSDDPNKPMSRVAGERAAIGAVEALAAPEQESEIRRVVAAAATAAADAAIREATAQMLAALGPTGEGPLVDGIAGAGERISAAVVSGARNEVASMFPDCHGPDAIGCVERRVQALTRSAGAGFSIGLREGLRWPLLFLACALGIVAGAVGHWAWSTRPRSRARVLRTT